MRLIDAGELVLQVDCLETCRCGKAKDWMIPISEVCREICDAPTIDAVPVVHGEWEWNINYGFYYCSKCQAVSPREDQDGEYCDCPNYCPNCGAKMDGGKPQ